MRAAAEHLIKCGGHTVMSGLKYFAEFVIIVIVLFMVIAAIAIAVTAISSAVGCGILLYAGIKRKAKPPISVIFIVFGAVMIVFSLFLLFLILSAALAFFTGFTGI